MIPLVKKLNSEPLTFDVLDILREESGEPVLVPSNMLKVIDYNVEFLKIKRELKGKVNFVSDDSNAGKTLKLHPRVIKIEKLFPAIIDLYSIMKKRNSIYYFKAANEDNFNVKLDINDRILDEPNLEERVFREIGPVKQEPIFEMAKRTNNSSHSRPYVSRHHSIYMRSPFGGYMGTFQLNGGFHNFYNNVNSPRRMERSTYYVGSKRNLTRYN